MPAVEPVLKKCSSPLWRNDLIKIISSIRANCVYTLHRRNVKCNHQGVIGWRRGTAPYAPTEPYVTLSRHTALVVESFKYRKLSTSVQTASGSRDEFAVTTRMHAPDYLALACVCGQSTWPSAGQPAPLPGITSIGKSDCNRLSTPEEWG